LAGYLFPKERPYVYLNFINLRNPRFKSGLFKRRQQMLDKETQRLINEVRKELHAIKVKVEKEENQKLLKAYQELLSTL